MKATKMLVIVMMVVAIAIVIVAGMYVHISNIENRGNGSKDINDNYTINNSISNYSIGNFSDLKIEFDKSIICLTATKTNDDIAITVTNLADNSIPIGNTTISVVLNSSCPVTASYTYGTAHYDRATSYIYGTVYYNRGTVYYSKSFDMPATRFFDFSSLPSSTIVRKSLVFSIDNWTSPLNAVYDGNYIEIGGIRHNFSIQTYCPPKNFVIDPDDLEISFYGTYDFSNVVDNGIVAYNETITQTLTIYNPTYMNSTQFWITSKLNSNLEDKVIMKADGTFLYWNEWNEHNNMLIKQLPSLGKIDIPISIAFVKGQYVGSHSYQCNLELYSGRSRAIPITVIT